MSWSWPYPFSRFFARLIAAQLSCPICGFLIQFGVRGGGADWDNKTSTVRCAGCMKIWQLGIVAWEIRGAPPAGIQTPKDQRPNLREQAELRLRAGGFWPKAGTKKVNDPVNRLIRGECCCDPLPWREECPIHGAERRRADWFEDQRRAKAAAAKTDRTDSKEE